MIMIMMMLKMVMMLLTINYDDSRSALSSSSLSQWSMSSDNEGKQNNYGLVSARLPHLALLRSSISSIIHLIPIIRLIICFSSLSFPHHHHPHLPHQYNQAPFLYHHHYQTQEGETKDSAGDCGVLLSPQPPLCCQPPCRVWSPAEK